MRVLIAPDKFKDALDAREVAAALAAGLRAAAVDAEVTCCPLGDGGEGTGRLLAHALPAQVQTAGVHDPLGRARTARWWLDRENNAGIVEMAEASGLCLLSPGERDATRTTSYGTGQLLRAALDAGCRHLTLCVGGSATVDGGAGCLQGLGWRLLDATGTTLDEPASGAKLPRIARIEPPEALLSADIEILCDVTNPLLGPDGAAAVFAPQKGASPAEVRRLEAALRHWADVLADFALRDLSDLPGAGAAGGLPAGLVATMQARLRPGFDEVVHRLSLREKAARCDLILTGEGRLDDQTGGGKVVAGVARLGRGLDKPVVALVGAARPAAGESIAQLARRLMLRDIVVVTPPGASLDAALAQTRDNLMKAVARYVRAKA
ncbi:MAG: glycerate kinase [Phycisphaerae bacterium]